MENLELPQKGLILSKINELRDLIHVIIGPRQVGKTTTVKQIKDSFKGNSQYITADGEVSRPGQWLQVIWQSAIDKSDHEKVELLIIDEIQKVENWSETIKLIWETRPESHPALIVLGSSSLAIHRGLSESLAGRYYLHRFYHWDLKQSQRLTSLELKDYLIYGGYPGAYRFINEPYEWLKYVKESIINAVIEKDILSMASVKSPALFRQSFDLICSYAAQEISYTKLLGQLQDRGNTDLVKHYIDLFEAAFLLKSLQKFSNKPVRRRSSSPKLIPLAPALYAQALDMDFNDENFGHAFEILVCNELLKLPGEIYYWRERNYEVDFIYKIGKSIHAIEVKYGKNKQTKGLEKFLEIYPTAKPHIITPENFSILASLR